MAYDKTSWVNDVTPVNANNLNKIENELELLDEGLANVYTKDETYTKSEVYSKEDFKVITFTKNLNARATASYTDSLASYIDDADNYAVISASMYVVKGTSPITGSSIVNKWLYTFINEIKTTVSGSSVVANVDMYAGDFQLYNDEGTPKIKYDLYNASDFQRDVKFRIVLMKVA